MLKHQQLHKQVSDHLREAILNGEYKPGQWLRQIHIAEELGVSQMPVREALKELASEGLVEHIPYRGVRVIQFSIEDIQDLYAHRSFLEGRAAGITAVTIQPDELDILFQLQEQMRQQMAPEALNAYRQLNRDFHQRIYRASQRAYLIRTLDQLWSAFPTMLWGNFRETAVTPLPQRDTHDLIEHEAILRALQEQDRTAAQNLVEQHIQAAGQHIIETLKQRDS